MKEKCLAEKTYDLSSKLNSVVLPKGLAGQFFTIYLEGKAVQSAIAFSDGSELIIEPDGSFFWNAEGLWQKANPEVFEIPDLALQNTLK